MAAKYSDHDIMTMIQEQKPLAEDFQNQLQLRDKRGHKERELGVQGADGNQFRLILRQSDFNPLDFSLILAFQPKNTNLLFRLRRYNGKSHEHTNHIEKNTFYDFHIHTATERYQDIGTREDAYAEPTDRFSDFHSALNCMFEDCGFDVPKDSQINCFEEI
jgi:hypothetical protein